MRGSQLCAPGQCTGAAHSPCNMAADLRVTGIAPDALRRPPPFPYHPHLSVHIRTPQCIFTAARGLPAPLQIHFLV